MTLLLPADPVVRVTPVKSSEQRVLAGTDATLEVRVEALPRPSDVKWEFQDRKLRSDGSKYIIDGP